MSQPKLLLADIEISPNIGYTWGKWEQNVIEFVQPWHLLSFGYKWLGGKTQVLSLPQFDNKERLLLAEVHRLLSEADVVIAQNGDAFDVKKINTRLLLHRFDPPPPYRTIDTLKVARARFAFNSNKLDDIGKDLDEGRKIKHRGIEMWIGCMAGDKDSWKSMIRYNKGDVELLERIYLRFRPWISNHPNLSVYTQSRVCPKCGSNHLQRRGSSLTNATTTIRLQCQDCGGWSRLPKRDPIPNRTDNA